MPWPRVFCLGRFRLRGRTLGRGHMQAGESRFSGEENCSKRQTIV